VTWASFQFVAGLATLYLGAEWLVRGAGRLARRFGVSALVVGLTVVAFGTSAPELVVSAFAAGRGQGDVAVGNVIGSNIFNILAILGVTALLFPIVVQRSLIVRELPIMLAATLLFPLLILDGRIDRVDALLLTAAFAVYLGAMIWLARRQPAIDLAGAAFDRDLLASDDPTHARVLHSVGLILVGIIALVAGARLLVDSALVFARTAGVSELVIGLTIVAAGTSLPELATATVAALRRESDIAIGNVVGSNIFNVLAILGIAGFVQPLPIHPELIRFEVPVMVAASLLLLPLAFTGRRLDRWEGALLLLAYLVFLLLLFVRSTA
jgi:cation:H+ antiporter